MPPPRGTTRAPNASCPFVLQGQPDHHRPHGRDIHGKDITCISNRRLCSSARLHELVICDEGRHLGHHSSTLGEDHHVTVLVALNTSCSGGEFYLRHDGNKIAVDIHPTIAGASAPQYDVFIYTPQTDPSSLAYTPGQITTLRPSIFSTFMVTFLILLALYDSRYCERKSRMNVMGEEPTSHSLNSATLQILFTSRHGSITLKQREILRTSADLILRPATVSTWKGCTSGSR